MTRQPPDPPQPQDHLGASRGPIRQSAGFTPGQAQAALAGIADQVNELLDQALHAALADTAKRREFAAWLGDPGGLAGANAAGNERGPCAVAAPRPGVNGPPAAAVAASSAPSAAPRGVPAWWLERRAKALFEEHDPAAFSAVPWPKSLHDGPYGHGGHPR